MRFLTLVTWDVIFVLIGGRGLEHIRDPNLVMAVLTDVPNAAVLCHHETSSSGNISALLAICAGNSPVNGEFPSQRPVTRSFDVFFDLRPNKRLSKQWWGWWYETPPRKLWRHCNASKCTLLTMPLQWRHIWRHGVSNHRHIDCLSTVCLGADQRNHQSSASLAFVRGIHRWPVNSLLKG